MNVLEEISNNNKSLKHKVQFDRVLIAQAKDNKMILLTHDKSLKRYKEKNIIFV